MFTSDLVCCFDQSTFTSDLVRCVLSISQLEFLRRYCQVILSLSSAPIRMSGILRRLILERQDQHGGSLPALTEDPTNKLATALLGMAVDLPNFQSTLRHRENLDMITKLQGAASVEELEEQRAAVATRHMMASYEEIRQQEKIEERRKALKGPTANEFVREYDNLSKNQVSLNAQLYGDEEAQELGKKLMKMKEEKEAVDAHFDNLEGLTTTLQTDKDALQQELKAKQDAETSLRQLLSAAQTEVITAVKEKADNIDKIARLTESLKAAERQLEAGKDSLEAKKKVLDNLAQASEILKNEVKNLKSAKGEFEKRTNAELDILRKANADAKVTEEDLRNEIVHLKTNLEAELAAETHRHAITEKDLKVVKRRL